MSRPMMAFLPLLLLLTSTRGVLAQDTPISPLSREYRSIKLGMPPEEVKILLMEDSRFNYRGDSSVSLLERPRASVIDAGGSVFILRGLFQFENESLVAIMLELNPLKTDWYTVYTSLEDKYGRPSELNPEKVWWDDAQTRIALERPLTVKYLDLQMFDTAQEERAEYRTWHEMSRKEFINDF